MRKFVAVGFVMLLCLSMFSAWAGGEQPIPVNAEKTARAFLGHDVVGYSGSFGFTRVLSNGATVEVNGGFGLSLNGLITSLIIDGQELVAPGDEPVGGIPPNMEGSATRFYLNLSGRDGVGASVIHGNFYTELLKTGDPIIVTLNPGWEKVMIPYSVPEGVNVNNLALRVDGNNFMFDPRLGGFEVWLDPVRGTDYEIIDVSTGIIYERGSIDHPASSEGTENIVNLRYSDGVINLLSNGKTWDYTPNSGLDSQVVRDEQIVSAKVFFTRTFGSGLWLGVNSPSGKRVEVREWKPLGEEMPLIFATDLWPEQGGMGKADSQYYYGNLQVPAGYDRLVITVLGNEETLPGDTFNLNIGLGGGKG